VSNSLQRHGLQHARLPCPSLSLGVCSNSSPLSLWCYLTISILCHPPSLFYFQSFPTSESFPMSQRFTTGGQSIDTSTLASVLPMNIQHWSSSGLTGWISLQSKGLSLESSPAPQFKSINPLALSLLYGPILTSIHDYWKRLWCWKRLKVKKRRGWQRIEMVR